MAWRTSGSRATFSLVIINPPASVIVFAVSRQAGANAVAVARSVRDLIAPVATRAAGLDSAHSDV